MPLDLEIVIVSWNVADLLKNCLDSIYGAPGARLDAGGVLHLGAYTAKVHVVDNASSDGSPQMVRKRFPAANLIISSTNLGFTRGNNLALRRCQARYVLLLNPDTRVVDDALVKMLDYMERHPQAGILGPQLRYGDGNLQSSRRRFPTFMTALMESTLLQQWFPKNRWAQRYYVQDVSADHVQDVDWVTGACMLVRRDVLRTVGLLDEAFFMYSEELDWCRRTIDAGWRVVYFPDAVVVHYGGRSSDQVVAERHIHFQRSKVLYFYKHHGWMMAEVLRLFILGTYLFQMVEEGLKCMVGHKRSLRRSRLRAYARVLRSGLRRRGPKGEAA
ncbi:MAG: glycosyltransferase family 2 protein [Chloroflexota bacterium]|nr:glycosyltransferase family 2 protein [Chloroflexota bacterium]